MEGLHAVIHKALFIGLFRVYFIGYNSFMTSHLMYADDVIFMGEWSFRNVSNLFSMLQCFYFSSGLNVQKSKLLGIGVFEEDINKMASILECGASGFPFTYLGVPVGCNMSRIVN